jgi:hypothetical protein
MGEPRGKIWLLLEEGENGDDRCRMNNNIGETKNLIGSGIHGCHFKFREWMEVHG